MCQPWLIISVKLTRVNYANVFISDDRTLYDAQNIFKQNSKYNNNNNNNTKILH